MTRRLAMEFARRLFEHAASEKYPTRSVEYMLAWMMLVWSFSCALPGELLSTGATVYIVAVAPELWWAVGGMTVSILRLIALIRNGGYAQSPMLRFIGAAMGLNWWLCLFVLYTASVSAGAADFPMRRVFLVFIFFEAYSCFRCGQDHAVMKAKLAADRLAKAPGGSQQPASDPGHG